LNELDKWSEPIKSELIIYEDTTKESSWDIQRKILVNDLQRGYDLLRLFDRIGGGLDIVHGGTYSGNKMFLYDMSTDGHPVSGSTGTGKYGRFRLKSSVFSGSTGNFPGGFGGYFGSG